MKRTKIKLALVLSSIVTFQACQPVDPAVVTGLSGLLNAGVTGYGIKKANQNSADMLKQLEKLNKKAPPIVVTGGGGTGGGGTGGGGMGGGGMGGGGTGPRPFSFGATKASMVNDFAQLDRADANGDGIINISEGYVLAGFYNQPSATFWPALLTQSDISKDGQITKNEFLLTL